MMFAPAQKIRSLSDVTMTVRTSGCSKRIPLDGVGEFDVDAEIVGIELQLIVRREAGVLAHSPWTAWRSGPSNVSCQCWYWSGGYQT
jgi:hypothetical protein